METIKSVIFDWGGVLIEDPVPGLMRYCTEAFGVGEEDYIRVHRKLNSDFQKGIVSEDELWAKVCRELKVPKPKVSSLWSQAFEKVYSPRADVFALARALRANGYEIGLLSNTELPAMQFFYQQGYDMFDALVFSCAVGTEKPESKIYELMLERLSCLPGEAVLIDDKQEYIDGAKQAGLNTIIFESVERTKRELSLLGVKVD